MKNSYKYRIGGLAPEGVIVANKGGTLTHTVADSALIFFPDREPIALTIFIVGNNVNVPRSGGEEAIANLSKEIMEYFLER